MSAMAAAFSVAPPRACKPIMFSSGQNGPPCAPSQATAWLFACLAIPSFTVARLEIDPNIERICSFLRAGSPASQACLAAGLAKEDVAAWLEANQYWVERAQAQFVVLACNKMMTEGGSNGARYLLERYAPAFAMAREDAGEDLSADDFNLDFDLSAIEL
jgi:hypothetical protein